MKLLNEEKVKDLINNKIATIQIDKYPEYGFHLLIDGVGDIYLSIDSCYNSGFIKFYLTEKD